MKAMKIPFELRSDADLSAYPIKNIVEGWFFRIDEISNGYFRVQGVDRSGHSVSRDGMNPDELFLKCKQDISEMFPREV